MTPCECISRRKSESQEETPPSTMGTSLVTPRIALDATLTMSLKRLQPGSRWKFQCDRLFGSFHSTIASTICQVQKLIMLGSGIEDSRTSNRTQWDCNLYRSYRFAGYAKHENYEGKL